MSYALAIPGKASALARRRLAPPPGTAIVRSGPDRPRSPPALRRRSDRAARAVPEGESDPNSRVHRRQRGCVVARCGRRAVQPGGADRPGGDLVRLGSGIVTELNSFARWARSRIAFISFSGSVWRRQPFVGRCDMWKASGERLERPATLAAGRSELRPRVLWLNELLGPGVG
jgi:hypothetical protein